MKVSVIIAAYNCAHVIGEAIEGIFSQTYDDWEIIICDDASTDNTLQVIEKYAQLDERITILKNAENKKAAYTRNQCIQVAKGEYIAIEDADDWSMPERLEKQVKYLDDNTHIDFVGVCNNSFDENGIWVKKLFKQYPTTKDFLWGFPFSHPSMMFRKEALQKVGGYRVAKETIRGQDADMVMRMYAEGLQGANILEHLHCYREDKAAFKRRTLKYRITTAKVNGTRFKEMGLMPLGYLFMWKPVVGGLIPRTILMRIRKWRNREEL